MKKNKLFFTALFAVSMLNTINASVSKATTANTLSRHARETAIEIGPENMMKFAFRDYLHSADYRSRKGVSAVQRHIVNLYPDRPDLYRRAACALGECLKVDGRYTQGEINRVVKYITELTDSYYGTK